MIELEELSYEVARMMRLGYEARAVMQRLGLSVDQLRATMDLIAERMR